MRPNTPDNTFMQRFDEVVQHFPDRIAISQKIAEGYRELSYKELWHQVVATGRALVALGLKPGARVAILSENRPEWVVAYLGILYAGGIAVPLDAQISPAEWARLLEDSESRNAFVSGMLMPKLKEVVGDLPFQIRLISFDSIGGDRDARTELSGLIEWADSLSSVPTLPQVSRPDNAVLIYTSGTTGKPKGVMLSHDNIISEVEFIPQIVKVDESDKLLCLLPLQHVFASNVNVLIPLSLGAQTTFIDTLKRSEIIEALASGGLTILATVPQFFYLFHDQIQAELGKKSFLVRRLFKGMLLLNRFSIRCLRLNLGRLLFGRIHDRFGRRLQLFVSGGSAFDPKVAQMFFDLGFTILQGYGLTETTGGCTITRPKNNVIGSVGLPLPRNEVKILDPDPTGVGEVLVRGALVMKGYYKNPEATAETIRDGWLYTGDLGRLDAKGNLYITGRKKEVIVLASGKNIYPDEVEAHYLQCPFIQEIAVLGISTPGAYESSERLHAVVVPNFDYMKAKKIANAKEILSYEIARLSNKLPQYKRLMSYQIQKEPLPRTTTRKVKRLELKRQIEHGELRPMESPGASKAISEEDEALKESGVGQVVLQRLRETYRREGPLDLGMNLELDLGFDSMERVEMLSTIEESLGIQLPDGFGAEIFTLRDLIRQLEVQSGSSGGSSSVSGQGWKSILSDESLEQEGEWHVHFSGTLLNLFKYIAMRFIYMFCRVFFRMEVRGRENVPFQAPFLICPNHLSYIDPFVVMSTLPFRIFQKTFFVGASDYFETWYMKLFARLTNVVPVDPDANLVRAMKVGAYGLRRGRILCIFPEGARSFDGGLMEFKKGAAILANEIGVPILPVGLMGTSEVWPRDSMRIRLSKVKVAFGKPFSPAPGAEANPYQADTDRLKSEVSRLTRE